MSATMSIRTLLASLALTTLPLVAVAGPIVPPGGTPSSTMKTLTDVEPRIAINSDNTPGNASAFHIINQSGSYYLTGHVVVTGDTTAILVNAPDVTIDMNGFGVIRVGTGTTNSSLVRSGGVSFSNIVVKNGTVKNSGKHAIELWGNSRVENVRVIKPLGVGIMMNGSRNVVADCVIDDPTQDAVLVGDDALVMNTSVFSPGTYGIVTGANSEVRSSRVLAAGQNGIQAGIGTLVQNCTVANCTAFGISGTFGATALRIMDNTVTNNGSGGIRVYSTSQVVGNTVSVSGLQVPGITVTFDGNRIEANLIHGGPDAVRIDASGDGNLVVRNQAFAPTNGNGFANVNAAGNQIGPVVTAAGSISSTSPHANFSR